MHCAVSLRPEGEPPPSILPMTLGLEESVKLASLGSRKLDYKQESRDYGFRGGRYAEQEGIRAATGD